MRARRRRQSVIKQPGRLNALIKLDDERQELIVLLLLCQVCGLLPKVTSKDTDSLTAGEHCLQWQLPDVPSLENGERGFSPETHKSRLCRIPPGNGLFPKPSAVVRSAHFMKSKVRSVPVKPSSIGAALPQHISFYIWGAEHLQDSLSNHQRQLGVQISVMPYLELGFLKNM